ncbi:MAG: hydrogenase [Desulfobulbus sp.]|jgi:hydrogenase-4 component B|uniref:proton-conducting transporter transmembrane domain-containing protein n=1 Tax=Desulfobulbus sp. TaxID=895 RepID=UPI00283EF6A7|nr:proton-conducting transporter membrane subunit [Desulfobulbus sp.]MDR2548661.1 hydrogenase [Desulfobulbus sp.]
MELLLTALGLILAGGLAPLPLLRRPACARIVHLVLLTAGCLAGLAALIRTWGQGIAPVFSCTWLHTLPLSLALDSLSAVFLVPVFLLAPVIALYGYHYLDRKAPVWQAGAHLFCFSLLTAAMVLVTLADNLPAFAMAWELMSLSSYLLVLYDHEHEESRKAATLYLLFTQTGALLLFIAFGLLFQATGTFAFAQWSQAPHAIKLAAFFLALAGFGSKAGILPLHIWLPHAHPAAPSHVSALMSGVMIKMGVYGLLRFYFLIDDPAPILGRTVLGLGMVSGVLGVVYALGKNDIKRLLAYSSIENIGIVLIGCGLGMVGIASGNQTMTAFGFAGGLLHMFNHALFKSLLFMGAGAVIQQTGCRHLDQLGGLMRRMPVTARTFLTGSVAIAGLPPLNGFVSEFLIYFAAFQGVRLNGPDGLLAMAAIIALALIGGLASACFTRVAGLVFLGEPRRPLPATVTEAGLSMRAAMIVLVLACLSIGLWPEPFIRLALNGLSDLALPAASQPALLGSLPGNLALATRIFLAVLLLLALCRHFIYRAKPIAQATTWGCGFTRPTARIQYTGTSYAREMVEFHRPFVKIHTTCGPISQIFPRPVRYASKVDDWAEIGLRRLLVAPILLIADKLRWIQHGHIQLYIGYIVLTIAVLLLTV